MTIARSEQIDLDATPYYHVISRCVRRAYLCGQDKETGLDYSHRKPWLVERIKYLSQYFSIDIAAYAVMDNHYHLVLHVDSERAKAWSNAHVIERWASLFPKNAKLIQELTKISPEHPNVLKAVAQWRERLMSISWYMSGINSYLARLCNDEDDCKGRFWEGRFKSQALLDEGAVLSAMAYVDLNPIRAGLCDTPEASDFTSIQERIQSAQKQDTGLQAKVKSQPESLMMFIEKDKEKDTPSSMDCPRIEFNLNDYLQLVDETGRVLREDKRGAIPAHLSPILERVGLSQHGWKAMANSLEAQFAFAVGQEHNMLLFGKHKKALKGTKLSSKLYLKAA